MPLELAVINSWPLINRVDALGALCFLTAECFQRINPDDIQHFFRLILEMGSYLNEARALIAQRKVLNALALLEKMIENSLETEEFLDQIILLRARYEDWISEEINYGDNRDSAVKLQKIRHSTLSLISQIEKTHPSLIKDSAFQHPLLNAKNRTKEQNDRIERVSSLIRQWEEKREVTTDPTELKRCELELKRLKKILNEYNEEA
ncbi:MAG: hypothetical protein H6557_25820 [Lewinellaceae bacterium]|nr:hypothetical protein [Phaeodactylibacter sp.]MCB9040054.1 hypothetical protein [Lewinellaceae bacterium]